MPEADWKPRRSNGSARGPGAQPGVLPQGFRRLRLGDAEPARAVQPRHRPYRHARGRPRLLPGPTTGLERVDLDIVPLAADGDALICTRGILRSLDPAGIAGARWCCGPAAAPPSSRSCRTSRSRSTSRTRCGSTPRASASRCSSAGRWRRGRSHNMTRLVDAGYRYGMPVLGVTAVGRELTRDARYLGLATRICAELGAQVVKTYYCEPDFETGHGRLPGAGRHGGRQEAARDRRAADGVRAVQEGASGVDMGRNIFQSERRRRCSRRCARVVHEEMPPERALELYQTLRDEAPARSPEPRCRAMSTRPAAPSSAACRRGPRLSVGILTADLSRLGDEMAIIERAGVGARPRRRHGRRLLPQLTFGPPIVKAIRTSMLVDVHLMVDDPLSRVTRSWLRVRTW